jgi:hypothetical protein
MKEIGLQPSTIGQPGGKETGQSVTHYIIPGGAFLSGLWGAAAAAPLPRGRTAGSKRKGTSRETV